VRELNPKRDGTVESHPSATCAEGWGTRWTILGIRGAKTNAAWASHPGRIVIADALTAVFRQGERSSRNCTGKGAMHRRSPEACASGLGFGVSILLGRRISEEAAKPGHRHTGHVPNFPR
jgi:hypothetical protein